MEDIKHAALFLLAADVLAGFACLIISGVTRVMAYFESWMFYNGCLLGVLAGCAVVLGLISGGVGIYKLVKRN